MNIKVRAALNTAALFAVTASSVVSAPYTLVELPETHAESPDSALETNTGLSDSAYDTADLAVIVAP